MSGPYQLDPERHEAIYAGQIAARYMPKSRPQEHPCAVITGGQPGSGKSGITALAIERFRASGYVLVDADKMRPYHPDYQKLMRADDRTAANLTHPDCGPWSTRLLRDGAAGRRNLIIDQTSRDPAALARMAQALRQVGYRVELHVMAVSPAASQLRIHQRYEGQRGQDGFGRFSTKDKHDEAFAGVAETVAAVETGRQVDRLCLYDHNVEPIYDNQLEQGQWRQPPRARQALDAERARPMTLAESLQLALDYGRLVGQLNSPRRNATQAEKAAMQACYAQAQAQARGIAPSLPQELLDSLAIHAALPHLSVVAGGLQALRAAGQGHALADVQRETLRGAFPDALIERHSDRFSRLGELAYIHLTQQQAVSERQSPNLSASDRTRAADQPASRSERSPGEPDL